MYHPRSKRCATVRQNNELAMVACDADDPAQEWTWQFLNQTQLELFNSNPERSVRQD